MSRRRRSNPVPKWAILLGGAAVIGGAAYWYFFKRKGAGGAAAGGKPFAPGVVNPQCATVAAGINRAQPLGTMKSAPIKKCRAAGGTVQWLNQGTKAAKQVCICSVAKGL